MNSRMFRVPLEGPIVQAEDAVNPMNTKEIY